MNDGLSFSIDFSLTEPHKKKADHFETQVKIKPKQLFQRIEDLKEHQKTTISYPLFEMYPDKIVSLSKNNNYIYAIINTINNCQSPKPMFESK